MDESTKAKDSDQIFSGEVKTEASVLKKPFFLHASIAYLYVGNLDDGDLKSYLARRVALSAGRAVVGLSSQVGDDILFGCCGIIISWNSRFATILTCATLLIGEEDTMPSNVKIMVYLPNGKEVPGAVSHVDLHHNIATLTVQSIPELPVATLASNCDLFRPGSDVVAVGRRIGPFNLLASCGEVKLEDEGFDSEDILSTSCLATNDFIGGPLVEYHSRYVVGLNFSDSQRTVFLPSTIVRRCLKHFKSYGRIVRPWLGMRIRNLDSLKLSQLEKVFQKFRVISGVFVEKVIKGSPAEVAGVFKGDIVTHCNGISVSSSLEYVGILFDEAELFMALNSDGATDCGVERQPFLIEVTIMRESCDQEETKSIIVDRFSPPEKNRWPLNTMDADMFC